MCLFNGLVVSEMKAFGDLIVYVLKKYKAFRLN